MGVQGECNHGIGSGELHTKSVANILETELNQMGAEMGQQWKGNAKAGRRGCAPHCYFLMIDGRKSTILC